MALDPISVIGGIFGAIASGIGQLIGATGGQKTNETEELKMQIALLQQQIAEEKKKSQQMLMYMGIGMVVFIVILVFLMRKK